MSNRRNYYSSEPGQMEPGQALYDMFGTGMELVRLLDNAKGGKNKNLAKLDYMDTLSSRLSNALNEQAKAKIPKAKTGVLAHPPVNDTLAPAPQGKIAGLLNRGLKRKGGTSPANDTVANAQGENIPGVVDTSNPYAENASIATADIPGREYEAPDRRPPKDKFVPPGQAPVSGSTPTKAAARYPDKYSDPTAMAIAKALSGENKGKGIHVDAAGNVNVTNTPPPGTEVIGEEKGFKAWMGKAKNRAMFGEIALALAGAAAQPIVRYGFDGTPHMQESGAQKFVAQASDIFKHHVYGPQMKNALAGEDYFGLSPDQELQVEASRQVGKDAGARMKQAETGKEDLGIRQQQVDQQGDLIAGQVARMKSQNLTDQLNAATESMYKKRSLDLAGKKQEEYINLAYQQLEEGSATKRYIAELGAQGRKEDALLLANTQLTINAVDAKTRAKLSATQELLHTKNVLLPNFLDKLTKVSKEAWDNTDNGYKYMFSVAQQAAKQAGYKLVETDTGDWYGNPEFALIINPKATPASLRKPIEAWQGLAGTAEPIEDLRKKTAERLKQYEENPVEKPPTYTRPTE